MFAQRYVSNFKSFAILVFYISLIEVITPHKRVAASGTLAERSPCHCHCEESTTRQPRPRLLRSARNDKGKRPLAEGAAEGAGGAPEADRIEDGHYNHHDADLRE